MLTMDFNISTDHQASKTNTVLICTEKYACPCYHTGLGLGHIRPHSLATNLTVICYNHPVSPIAWQCARVQQVTKIEMSRRKEQLVSMPSPTADMLISRLCNLNFWVKLYIKKFKNHFDGCFVIIDSRFLQKVYHKCRRRSIQTKVFYLRHSNQHRVLAGSAIYRQYPKLQPKPYQTISFSNQSQLQM